MKVLNCNYELLIPNIVSSDNCYLFDEAGKRYVDFESGVWCASLGHNNKQINKSIVRQMEIISHTGYRYTTKIVDEAAGRVLDLLGFTDGKCVFLSSGSEAVEFGVQLAKKIMGKTHFLCLDNYFLSSYGISAARSKEEWISLDLSKYSGDAARFLENVPFEKIGAFVFEPGNASGTASLPPKELIKVIESKVKENGGVIVTDEVTTGIGRTGKWFGFEHYDMHPDIVAIGKGVGNGYPVSVIALTKPISKAAEKLGFKYAQSHQNDPLGCAVIKEVISVIEDNDIISKTASMGAAFKSGLKLLSATHRCIKDVRGVGLMCIIELHHSEAVCLSKIHSELLDAGYIVGINVHASLLRFYPPLTIEEAEIKNIVEALDAILRRMS